MTDPTQIDYISEVLQQIKSDCTKHSQDILERIECLARIIQEAKEAKICTNGKQNYSGQKEETFIIDQGYYLGAVDGSSKWFSGFKKASFCAVFNNNHPLNHAEISELEPISYVAELQGIRLILRIADKHNIFPLMIIIDNLPALEAASIAIKNPNRIDFEDLSSNREDIAEILREIGELSRDREIKLQHIKSHKSIPGTHSRINALADMLCKRILDINYQIAQDNTQVNHLLTYNI